MMNLKVIFMNLKSYFLNLFFNLFVDVSWQMHMQ